MKSPPTKSSGWQELDASAHEALTRFFSRTGWEPVTYDRPFDEALAAADDGEDEPPGEYEIRQRMVGVLEFFRFLKARGVHPADMLKQLAAAGRACHVEPFHVMTMEEVAGLFGQVKASHSWRCKLLTKEIELSGMRGSQLPGQKSKQASESYRRLRTGKRKKRPPPAKSRPVASGSRSRRPRRRPEPDFPPSKSNR